MSDEIERAIITSRGRRVILDTDLAALYGVGTKRLNEQVRRNIDRFPDDFMFRLSVQEVEAMRSQIATASRRNLRFRPYAFTEHGAIMAANVLNSKIAIEASILIVRTFIQMRGVFAEQLELKKRLQDLEQKLSRGFSRHEEELQEIRFLIARLESPPETKRRRIGFYKEPDEG